MADYEIAHESKKDREARVSAEREALIADRRARVAAMMGGA